MPPSLPKPAAVAKVLERLVATAREHDMFAPRATVVIAVSGGPDSTCLLHALVRVQRLLRIRRLVVCHVDHRLRPESRRDAAYVRRQADRLGVPFFLRSAMTAPAAGESVEAWARETRYAALSEVREEVGATAVATGHTADDQAETVLLALVRGGGLEALGGMRPVRDGIVRPLLDVTAAETRAFCRALRLRPLADPMNEDPRYLRAAIRHRAIPALEAPVGREVRGTFVRTAARLRQDGDLLASMASEAAADLIEPTERGVRLRAGALAAIPRPIASRVVRLALLEVDVVPEGSHVEAVLGLAAGRSGRRVALPGGVAARREREYVSLSFPPG